ncbi:hypothetical protein MMC25_005719 [Agyrium rufum]|nr:hypothetical protein [Agyrium rufum]
MTDRSRRKSLSLSTFRSNFSSMDSLCGTDSEQSTRLRKQRRDPLLAMSPLTPSTPDPSSPGLVRTTSGVSIGRSPSPMSRTHSQGRPLRASGGLGSYRSLQSLGDESEAVDFSDSTTPSSLTSEVPIYAIDTSRMTVIHHGDVGILGGMWSSKKTAYLVLTDTHLIRFKSQGNAADLFGAIPHPRGHAAPPIRHSRLSSTGSVHGLTTASEGCAPLTNLVSIHNLDDGKPYFSWQVTFLNDETALGLNWEFHPDDSDDRYTWISLIRETTLRQKLLNPPHYPQRIVHHIVNRLEKEGDYDRQHLRILRVIKRSLRNGRRSSTDKLAELVTTVGYMAIGMYKVHLVPPPPHPGSDQAKESKTYDSFSASYGLLALQSISLQPAEDLICIAFRQPLKPRVSWHLGSSVASDVALLLRQSIEYLRPLYKAQPYEWSVPFLRSEDCLPSLIAFEEDKDICSRFQTTLIAHCIAYGISTTSIQYNIHEPQCTADISYKPELELLPPNERRRSQYNTLEWLAILRSLRYNGSFRTLNFRNASFNSIHDVQDEYVKDDFVLSSRDGTRPLVYHSPTPYLIGQELGAIALYNRKLLKIDFTGCLGSAKRSKQLASSRYPDARTSALEGAPEGTHFCESIFKACASGTSDLSWFVLSGIRLNRTDITAMTDCLKIKRSHVRGLELSGCNISAEMRTELLEAMKVGQNGTMEWLDLSQNPGRMGANVLNSCLRNFTSIRVLNLSYLSFSSGLESLISYDTLKRWRLEELSLTDIPLNVRTIQAIAAYLSTSNSSTLHTLNLDHCCLGGDDVALILRSLSTGFPNGRDMHLNISGNRLEREHDDFIEPLVNYPSPTRLSMHSIEYSDQKNFQKLLHAISQSKYITYLDLSKTFLHIESSEETAAVMAQMFATNTSIQELNISGSHASHEADTLGREFCTAISGLAHNNHLKVLRMQHQALGFPGASALADVLRTNTCLEELYCESNDLTLQSFSTIVHALEQNTSLVFLSEMRKDRDRHHRIVHNEVAAIQAQPGRGGHPSTSSSAMANAGPGSRMSAMSTMRAISASTKKHSSSRRLSAVLRAPLTSPSQVEKEAISTLVQAAPKKRTSLSKLITTSTSGSRPTSSSSPISAGAGSPRRAQSGQHSTPLGFSPPSSTRASTALLEPDIPAALAVLERKWDSEMALCQRYLRRNWARKMDWDEQDAAVIEWVEKGVVGEQAVQAEEVEYSGDSFGASLSPTLTNSSIGAGAGGITGQGAGLGAGPGAMGRSPLWEVEAVEEEDDEKGIEAGLHSGLRYLAISGMAGRREESGSSEETDCSSGSGLMMIGEKDMHG